MLHEFISLNRNEIIRRCRAKVAARLHPLPTKAEIDHGVPMFLDQLVDALRGGATANDAISKSALRHGRDLLEQGYTDSQVVHDYGDICQAITDLAVQSNAPINTDDFRTLNRCLDDAIAGAVTEYGRARNVATRNREAARGTERLGFFAHEVRNLTHTALLAFDVLKTGNVGVGGSTGSVLGRSLAGLQALIERSLNEVRLTRGVQNREAFVVSEFIDAVAAGAALEADARNLALTIVRGGNDVSVEADRQVLAAVISNLLQNAFKFTRAHSTVVLRAQATETRVTIEIEDQCGGLGDSDVNELFRPYEQNRGDRTGLGLGLAYSRWGVEANHGTLSARSIPGQGCVFAIDLPRLAVPNAAMA